MSKTFRPWDVDQAWLLPLSVHQFVPPGHLAHFVRDTVREALDLSAITGVYKAEQGQPPYHPGMLVAPAAVWLQPRHLLQPPTGAGVRGTGGHDGRHRAEPAGLPHHQRLPQAAPAGAAAALRAGAAALPGGRPGQAGPRGRGRHQAARQREQAQGDELQAYGQPGTEARRRGRILAGPGRCRGRRRGRPAWRGSAR